MHDDEAARTAIAAEMSRLGLTATAPPASPSSAKHCHDIGCCWSCHAGTPTHDCQHSGSNTAPNPSDGNA